jgi:nucleotide-binding universal stress UspA family protein
MRKMLVPINAASGARTQATLAEVIALYRDEPAQIHLLNVQIPVSRHVSDFFKSGELHAIHLEAGMEELAPAKATLDAAGVPYTAHIKVGHSAQTIVQTAQELGCDQIVMGGTPQTGFAEKMFGTLANQVRHLLGVSGTCQVIGS